LCPLLFCNEILKKGGQKKSCKKEIKRKPILQQRVAGAGLLRILKNLEKEKKEKEKKRIIYSIFNGVWGWGFFLIYSFSFIKNVATLAIIHSRN
jgi:hypothetical protein